MTEVTMRAGVIDLIRFATLSIAYVASYAKSIPATLSALRNE